MEEGEAFYVIHYFYREKDSSRWMRPHTPWVLSMPKKQAMAVVRSSFRYWRQQGIRLKHVRVERVEVPY